MVNDVRRAYFFAPARRELYIEMPMEDRQPGDEDRVARLNLSMYGTRDAARNWAFEYASVLKDMGFTQGKASPCHFHHCTRNIRTVVHGDDFLSVGPQEELKRMKMQLEERFDLKSSVLGPDKGEQREIRNPNQVMQWGNEGIIWAGKSKRGKQSGRQRGERKEKRGRRQRRRKKRRRRGRREEGGGKEEWKGCEANEAK